MSLGFLLPNLVTSRQPLIQTTSFVPWLLQISKTVISFLALSRPTPCYALSPDETLFNSSVLLKVGSRG